MTLTPKTRSTPARSTSATQPLVIDAGVVDERVDRAELPVDRPEHRHDVLFAAHIGLDDQGPPPLGPDGRRHLVRPLARAHVVDAHVVALSGRHLRDRRPDAATSPRHQEHAHPSSTLLLRETPRAPRMPQSRYRSHSSRLVGSVTDAGRSRCNASSAARRPVASAPWTHSAPPSVAVASPAQKSGGVGAARSARKCAPPTGSTLDGAPRPGIRRPVGYLEAQQLRADIGLREHLSEHLDQERGGAIGVPGHGEGRPGAEKRDQGRRPRPVPERHTEAEERGVRSAEARDRPGPRFPEWPAELGDQLAAWPHSAYRPWPPSSGPGGRVERRSRWPEDPYRQGTTAVRPLERLAASACAATPAADRSRVVTGDASRMRSANGRLSAPQSSA